MQEMELTGLSLVRHLWVHYHNDPESIGITHEFLLGRDILVAPVLDESSTKVNVYLPPGDTWKDLWTGETYDLHLSNGKHLEVNAPIGITPCFYRANAPMADEFAKIPTLLPKGA